MFYAESLGEALRLGDVVRGFVSSTTMVTKAAFGREQREFQLQITSPDYCVVLSPCCSIRGSVLSLAPLTQLRGNIFLNPYFAADPTNINRLVAPEKQLVPAQWNALSREQRLARQAAGPAYSLLEYFVYAQSALFDEYETRAKGGTTFRTGCYMISFQDAFRVHCDLKSSVQAKALELCVWTRQELRDKLAHYYSRPTAEDQALLG